MQLSHEYTIEPTENVEHYRLAGTEILLEPDSVRFTLGGASGWETFVLHPEIAFALARKIVAFYDEEGLGA